MITQRKFIKILLKNYDILKDIQGFANLQQLKKMVCSELDIPIEDFDKYKKIVKDEGLLTFSIMPAREIENLKIKIRQ